MEGGKGTFPSEGKRHPKTRGKKERARGLESQVTWAEEGCAEQGLRAGIGDQSARRKNSTCCGG